MIDRLASIFGRHVYEFGQEPAFPQAGMRISSYILKKKGISFPLSDVVIATDCIDHGLVLMESDRHYGTIAANLILKRYAYLTSS